MHDLVRGTFEKKTFLGGILRDDNIFLGRNLRNFMWAFLIFGGKVPPAIGISMMIDLVDAASNNLSSPMFVFFAPCSYSVIVLILDL